MTRWQRFLRFPVTRLVLGMIWLAAPFAVLQIIGDAAGLQIGEPGSAVLALAIAAAALAAYVSFVRIVERRRPEELDGTGAARELALGLALGGAVFAATMLAICVGASCAIGPGDGLAAAGVALAWAVAAAVFEELAIRGILFRIIEQSLGTWLALLVSAAIFGALHGMNPGATVAGCAAIGIEAGILLAAAFVLTRRLWLPIGLHLAWNFTESGVFGSTVSGNPMHGLAATTTSGPELITGGAFGPEASIAAVALCLAVAVALLVLGHRRGRFVTPAWRR
jgi:uncharacterized protein